jgi:DNA-binding MarR family transcriptional regulator
MRQQDTIFQAIGQLQHLSSLFGKRRAQLARRVGLTEAQWRVLEGVATEHFMPSMFADGLDNSRAAISNILRQLQEKKLVRASISTNDGRQRKYELTAKGAKTQKALRNLRSRAIRDIWSDLPPDDLAAFHRLCTQLIGRLRDYAEKEEANEKGRRKKRA